MIAKHSVFLTAGDKVRTRRTSTLLQQPLQQADQATSCTDSYRTDSSQLHHIHFTTSLHNDEQHRQQLLAGAAAHGRDDQGRPAQSQDDGQLDGQRARRQHLADLLRLILLGH